MATSDKYDRQLRLWGPVGQRNLAAAHVLLIQADAVGAETLKNLVLPGIGSFTILDDHRVSADDLGNNFFVTVDSLGRPRAEVRLSSLLPLNLTNYLLSYSTLTLLAHRWFVSFCAR